MRACLFILLILSLPLQAADPAPTNELFERWKNRVLQIQVIDRQAGTKAGIGSGFFAGEPGWIVSNYHVIAELVNRPGEYSARFLADGGIEGELELLAVDAVHDLALLRASNLEQEALPLASAGPPRGSRLYSMGYPYDIGLTIVEGTYNGMLEKSLYEKLHFTGSINPGMSGGPSLNADGEVVGVNVSTAGNQVSFLVPVQYVAAMLTSASDAAAGSEQLDNSVATQLLDNQAALSERLLQAETPRTRLGDYTVPAGLAHYINCWGNSQDDEDSEIRQVYYHCQTQDDIFLSEALGTGIIRYRHELLSSTDLHPMRFWQQLQKRGYYPKIRLDGDEPSVTNYSCQTDFVQRPGLPMKATFCVRRYRRMEGLYDAYLHLTSLVSSREALQSTLVLAGFDWANTRRLSETFIDAFDWQEAAP